MCKCLLKPCIKFAVVSVLSRVEAAWGGTTKGFGCGGMTKWGWPLTQSTCLHLPPAAMTTLPYPCKMPHTRVPGHQSRTRLRQTGSAGACDLDASSTEAGEVNKSCLTHACTVVRQGPAICKNYFHLKGKGWDTRSADSEMPLHTWSRTRTLSWERAALLVGVQPLSSGRAPPVWAFVVCHA